MLGSCSPLPGRDGFRILVGLMLGEDPESSLRQMASDGANDGRRAMAQFRGRRHNRWG
jgi:hypothetical protein